MFLEKPYHIEEAFTSQFCDNLLHLGEQKQIEEAKIKDGNQVNRQSKVSWIKDKQVEITKAINRVNKKNNWNFELSAIEPLQYTIYGEKDFYDWHIDSHTKPYDNGLIRKISFTICLNEDYEGGEFELSLPNPKPEKHKFFKFNKVFKKGTLIVFPSFMWHKVNPVAKGFRKVIVGWVLGKPFI
jgi:PKHD-type hydroxylase